MSLNKNANVFPFNYDRDWALTALLLNYTDKSDHGTKRTIYQ